MRHHHATSVMELCLKGRRYHCWDHRHWTHKRTTSYSRRITIENRRVVEVGRLLNKIGWSHYIGGCHRIAPGGVEFAVGIFGHGGELVG